MEFREVVAALKRRLPLVAALVLIGLLAGGVLNMISPSSYKATSVVYFSIKGSTSVEGLYQGNSMVQQQMGSYEMLATSPIVLDPVIQQLGLQQSADDLANKVKASYQSQTVLLTIDVTDSSARRATDIANGIANEVSASANRLAGAKDPSIGVVGTVIKPASVPVKASSPQLLRSLALGLVGGLILGIALAIILESLKGTPRREAESR